MIKKNNLYCMDSIAGMSEMDSSSVDLVFTSPPYANLRKYDLEGAGCIDPDKYVDWFLLFAEQIKRVLKPTGSFILNINDRVVDGERHLYVFDLVSALKRQVGFKYFERFIWLKKNAMPWSSLKRVTDEIEYIFWFYKDDYILNQDSIRREYAESSLKRYQYSYAAEKNGFRPKDGEVFTENPKGAKAGNVLFLPTSMDKNNPHKAPFPVELADWFIRASTNEGDLVLDPFIGSGSSAVAAKRLGRDYIGFDIVQENINYAKNRLLIS